MKWDKATRHPPSLQPVLLSIHSHPSCAIDRSCCCAMVPVHACPLRSPSASAGEREREREIVQPPQRARLVALHSTLTQVLRTISLFHRVRGVVRSSQVSVYVRPHHVSLGRQVCGSVGGAVRAVPPSSVRRRVVLTARGIASTSRFMAAQCSTSQKSYVYARSEAHRITARPTSRRRAASIAGG